jgi:hypothetical protein
VSGDFAKIEGNLLNNLFTFALVLLGWAIAATRRVYQVAKQQ